LNEIYKKNIIPYAAKLT